MSNEQAFLIDGISAIAIHNGVVRVQFMRLGVDERSMPEVELHIPVESLASVIEALKKVLP